MREVTCGCFATVGFLVLIWFYIYIYPFQKHSSLPFPPPSPSDEDKLKALAKHFAMEVLAGIEPGGFFSSY